MDGGFSHADGWAMHPPFSFRSCRKENGPWTVQKKRTLRRVGPRRRGLSSAGGRRLDLPPVGAVKTSCSWGNLWPGEDPDTACFSFRWRYPGIRRAPGNGRIKVSAPTDWARDASLPGRGLRCIFFCGLRLFRRSSCQAHGCPRVKRIGRLPECRGSGSGARRAEYPGPPRGFCQTGSRGSGEAKLPEYIAPGRRALHLVGTDSHDPRI